MLDASGPQHLLLAETLGLAMARRASEILERHRAALTSGDSAACRAVVPALGAPMTRKSGMATGASMGGTRGFVIFDKNSRT